MQTIRVRHALYIPLSLETMHIKFIGQESGEIAPHQSIARSSCKTPTKAGVILQTLGGATLICPPVSIGCNGRSILIALLRRATATS